MQIAALKASGAEKLCPIKIGRIVKIAVIKRRMPKKLSLPKTCLNKSALCRPQRDGRVGQAAAGGTILCQLQHELCLASICFGGPCQSGKNSRVQKHGAFEVSPAREGGASRSQPSQRRRRFWKSAQPEKAALVEVSPAREGGACEVSPAREGGACRSQPSQRRRRLSKSALPEKAALVK